MYLFFKSKKYDPTPYSYIKNWIHSKFGCPIQNCDVDLLKTQTRGNGLFEIHILCDCGRDYIIPKDYPRY